MPPSKGKPPSPKDEQPARASSARQGDAKSAGDQGEPTEDKGKQIARRTSARIANRKPAKDSCDSDEKSADESAPSVGMPKGKSANDKGKQPARGAPSARNSTRKPAKNARGSANKSTKVSAPRGKKEHLLKGEPPLVNARDMFDDMVTRVDHSVLWERPVRISVGTACSGTDAPIFAFHLLQEAIEINYHIEGKGKGKPFEVDHVFSCEIEPVKQGFIRRNVPGNPIIFRDVVEMAYAARNRNEAVEIMTAGGYKREMPDKRLDIFFCGSSCVDYSNLNTKKPKDNIGALKAFIKNDKKLVYQPYQHPNTPFEAALDNAFMDIKAGATGESVRTFFSSLIFINYHRPKVVIFENVQNAPWEIYAQQVFPLVGYYTTFLRVDTKDYYLPQTRNRGYILAIDIRDNGALSPQTAPKVLEAWKQLMKECKRQPSAPVTSFLLGSDDPATILARSDLETDSQNNTSWEKSSLRHESTRRQFSLSADENPFSKKVMRNGRVIGPVYPTHSHQEWWKRQTGRVIDLMDIIEAVGNRNGIYLQHKTSVVDVSQNVDRINPFKKPTGSGKVELKENLGVTGCITPSGQPIVTNLLRLVTGTEVLALQGMPIEEITISTESQAQLRNLAGNAMTVTVVGAATFAALLSLKKADGTFFDKYLDEHGSCQDNRLTLRPGNFLALEDHSGCAFPSSDSELSPLVHISPSILATVQKMTRRCPCPPVILPPTRAPTLLICQDCGTGLCSTCCGNPTHNLVVHQNDAMLSAEEGKVALKSLLPEAFELSLTWDDLQLQSIFETSSMTDLEACTTTMKQVYNMMDKVLGTRTRYFLSDIEVTEVVTVVYTAQHSVANLVLDPSGTAIWYIYVTHSWKKDPRGGLPKDFDYSQPIARGILEQTSDFATLPSWSFWAPWKVDLVVDLYKSSARHVQIQDVTVDATCGTAGDELFTMTGNDAETTPSMFIFRDCTPLETPAEDCVVFSPTMRRLEPHEHREVYLRLKPDVVRLDHLPPGHTTKVPGSWSGFWVPCSEQTRVLLEPVKLVTTRWGVPDHFSAQPCHFEKEGASLDQPACGLVQVTTSLTAFPISKATDHKLRVANLSQHGFIKIPSTQRNAFLREFAFASSAVRGSNVPERFRVAGSDGIIGGYDWIPVDGCNTCTVVPPKVWMRNGVIKRESVEDPDEALQFENRHRNLPSPITVAARLLPENQLDFRILLKPRVLPCKAKAHLLKAHQTVHSGFEAVKFQSQLYFCVVLDNAYPQHLQFGSLFDQIEPCSEEHSAGVIPMPGLRVRTPRFVSQRHSLRRDQEGAVMWMIQRERSPADFLEVEIEEEIVGPVSMRVLGKAVWQTKFPVSSRGGVVAHEIGYGKTVVVLGLLDHMRDHDKSVSIKDRRSADDIWQQEFKSPDERPCSDSDHKPTFFFHIKATLIIVPAHLTDQWRNEVAKFLGLQKSSEDYAVIVIKTAKQFINCTKEQLARAEIIILSTSVLTHTLLKNFTYLSGMPDVEPEKLSNRHKEMWFQDILRMNRMLLSRYLAGEEAGTTPEKLMEDIRDFRNDHVASLAKQRSKQESNFVTDSSRKEYKHKRASSKSKTKRASSESKTDIKDANNTPEQSSMDNNEWDFCWLLACSFARIVWDECSYDDSNRNKCTALFVGNTLANAKWLLSGTPKVFDLAETCRTAKVFGVHLARHEPRIMPGLDTVTNGPVVPQLSKSEEYHMYSSGLKSPLLALERHRQAETFVGQYYRANHLESRTLEWEEQEVKVPFPATAAMRYHLAHQEALDVDMDYTALSPHAREEVALPGAELEDKEAAAKQLLGLLACGLGTGLKCGGDQMFVFIQQRRAVMDRIGKDLKFLWDKAMWLCGWLELLVERKGTEKSLIATIRPYLTQVRLMCSDLKESHTTESYDKFEGLQVFDKEASCLIPDYKNLVPISIAESWDNTKFFARTAHYTWTTFFEATKIKSESLKPDEARYLARTRCRRELITEHTFQPESESESQLDDVSLIRDHLATLCKDKKPQVSMSSSAGLDKLDKKTLLDEARVYNLKVAPSTTAETLKKLIREHKSGIASGDKYWDGRGPPSRYQSFHGVRSPEAAFKEFKVILGQLYRTRQDYRAAVREQVFLPRFESIVEGAHGPHSRKECDGCKKPLESLGASFLVVSCGHLLCSTCRSATLSRYCPSQGCVSFIHERPVLRCSEMPRYNEHRNRVAHIVEHVGGILEKNDNERVLVFAQYSILLQALAKELKAVDPALSNLPTLSKEGDVSEALEEFKRGLAGRVMLLDIEDETSAGSNLTIANHVVFANPFSHSDPGHQKRTLSQAKGRCIRYGQKKKVQVYHFFAPNTVEEDIYREYATLINPPPATVIPQQHSTIPSI
ncbi:hypothetical protein QBC35DRAFT_471233 [Podospora australis]|uniref:RING-type domain-containing protein n=1 Tax=Podospora australis TaxID=1536484 RepID=A0AAN6WZA8_9PEZI|nr:hypothetical protein QBC35DRAFT_471233 [Podospora australis]